MGTLQFPAAVPALGRELVAFLPTVAVPTAVTVAEAKSATTVLLTCAIRGFSPTAEQASSKKYRHCSKQGFDVPGRVDWSIEDVTFIDDPQAQNSATGYLHKALVEGTKGWILRRRGLDADPTNFVDFAAAQLYDIFQVTWGVRRPVPVAAEEEGQEFEYMQKPFVTGLRYEGSIAA